MPSRATFLALLLLSVQPAHALPAGVCELYVDKTAQPTDVLAGQEVEITLTLEGRCPPGTEARPADIVLAIDRSASQGDNGTWEPTIQAATTFVELIDFSRHQVGLLTFSGGLPILDPPTVLRQPLTSDGQAVKAALAAIPPPPVFTGPTNITAAVQAAQAELTSPRHRSEAQPVLVLLSDGEHNARGTVSPVEAATAAKDAGTVIITIGLAVNEAAAATLRAMASQPELYFPAPSGDQLQGVLRQVAGEVSSGGRMRALTVTDLLSQEVEYVAGSAEPAAALRANTLIWNLPSLPPTGWRARYRIRPLTVGTYPTNKLAYVDFTDADGSAGSRVFPLPLITVRQPQQFATFLPAIYRRYCQPAQPFDVVLALDTSSSMWGEKLTRTRAAAREFLQYLEMPPSQAGVVAFNVQPWLIAPLTTDRAAALAALDQLPLAEGTRLDLALAAATAELGSKRHRRGHLAVLILLTDGRQVGPRQAVLDEAAAARRMGITVYTIGIGDDVDPDLLTAVAGHPDRYYFAPSTANLQLIYRDIVGSLPCLRP